MKFFGENIKSIRKKSNLKQAEIKAAIGIEPTTWSNYENGKSFPNLKLFDEICKYFDISADDLLNKDLSDVQVNKNNLDFYKRENVQVNVQEDVQVNKQKVISSALPGMPENVLHDGDPPYDTPQQLIKTLSIAIKGLEAANAMLQQRNAVLEQENNLLKRDSPVINKHMEDKDAKSA